jgi:hypothetical protein
MSLALRRIGFASLLGLGTVISPAGAIADEPSFGANDVPTVFFINKSDDHNRVDYGIRLDDRCGPAKDDAVFPYWREFENAPPVRTHSLGLFEYVAYGLSDQRTVRRTQTGADQLIALKQFGRPIFVTTTKGSDGHCTAIARSTIQGVEHAQLLSIFVKLRGPMMVDYIDVKGTDLATGKALEERIKK